MKDESSYDMSSTIQAAEESILRISEELRRMKTAADLLEESGKRSVRLQVAVEGLVIEIGTLIEVSGLIIESMTELEVNGLASELRTTLVNCIEDLKSEVSAEAKSTTERVGLEVQTNLSQRLDNLVSGLTSKTESANDAVMKRLDTLGEQTTELRQMIEQSSKRKGLFG